MVPLAGVYEARRQGLIGADESVLVLATGSGLKDIRGAMRAVTLPEAIQPELAEVARAIDVAP